MDFPQEIKRIIMYYYQCSMRDKSTKEQVLRDLENKTALIKTELNTLADRDPEWSRRKIDNIGRCLDILDALRLATFGKAVKLIPQ